MIKMWAEAVSLRSPWRGTLLYRLPHDFSSGPTFSTQVSPWVSQQHPPPPFTFLDADTTRDTISRSKKAAEEDVPVVTRLQGLGTCCHGPLGGRLGPRWLIFDGGLTESLPQSGQVYWEEAGLPSCRLQLLVAPGIPWLVTASCQSPPVSSHELFL